MTDSAIRTEAQLRERLQSQSAFRQALTIGHGIAELSALGFGSVTLHDWNTHRPGAGVDSGHTYSCFRYCAKSDPHGTAFDLSDDTYEYRCHIAADGATPTQAMVNLLSEARTKAAPK